MNSLHGKQYFSKYSQTGRTRQKNPGRKILPGIHYMEKNLVVLSLFPVSTASAATTRATVSARSTSLSL